MLMIDNCPFLETATLAQWSCLALALSFESGKYMAIHQIYHGL